MKSGCYSVSRCTMKKMLQTARNVPWLRYEKGQQLNTLSQECVCFRETQCSTEQYGLIIIGMHKLKHPFCTQFKSVPYSCALVKLSFLVNPVLPNFWYLGDVFFGSAGPTLRAELELGRGRIVGLGTG